MAIAPMLQAESNYEYMQKEKIIIEKEKALMREGDDFIPGQSFYASKKWMSRRVHQLDKKLQATEQRRAGEREREKPRIDFYYTKR